MTGTESPCRAHGLFDFREMRLEGDRRVRPIDADVLISEMQETANFIARGTGKTAGLAILMKFIEIVKMYPTVEPKRGQWIKSETSEAFDIAGVKTWALKITCSECGFVHRAIEAHVCYGWCPICGAKMDSKIEGSEIDEEGAE